MSAIDDVVKAIQNARDVEERQRQILQPFVSSGWRVSGENFVTKGLKGGAWVGVSSQGDILTIRVFPGGVNHAVATVDEALAFVAELEQRL
ncbi:MAG: hypothetical protein OXF93_15585 [Acidobacteria bacterium]|nr:hypothetical protein [Acidobacteriota bacterium]